MADRFAQMVQRGTISKAEARRRRQQQAQNAAPMRRQQPQPAPAPRRRRRQQSGGGSAGPLYSAAAGVPRVAVLGDGTVRVSHKELCAVVLPDRDPDGGIYEKGLCAPIGIDALPYVAQSYSAYSRARFRKCVFHWVPSVSANANGTISLAGTVENVGIPNAMMPLNLTGGKFAHINTPMRVEVPLQACGDDWFSTHATNPFGTAWLVLNVRVDTNATAGYVQVEYTMELANPVFNGGPPVNPHFASARLLDMGVRPVAEDEQDDEEEILDARDLTRAMKDLMKINVALRDELAEVKAQLNQTRDTKLGMTPSFSSFAGSLAARRPTSEDSKTRSSSLGETKAKKAEVNEEI